MDPFRHDPYDSDSGDDGSFSGAVAEHAQTLTAHAKALMRGDLEVSPLVTNVPPMPEARPANAKPAPVIPSNFREGMQQVALKKRKIDPQAVAHAFVEESQEIVLPQPSSIHHVQEEEAQQHFLSTSLPSTEGMNPPPPPAAAVKSSPMSSGTDMLAVLTSAASQSIPVAEKPTERTKPAAPVPETAPQQGHADDRKTSNGGIFDDADDDMSVEAPKYDVPTAADPSAAGSTTEGETSTALPKKTTLPEVTGTGEVSKLKEQENASTGTAEVSKFKEQEKASTGTAEVSKLEEQEKASTGTAGVSKLKEQEKTSTASKDEKPPPSGQETKVAALPVNAGKRKSIPKIVKKVLTAKREKDLTDSMLCDKEDLLDYLPKEDCMFLGEHFWIFTVEQLRSVLGATSEYAKEIRNLLLTKLSESQLLKNGAVAAKESGTPDEVTGGRVAAEERLRLWQTQIDSGAKGNSVEKRFPLDGPISFLFPKATRNFLASVRVDTLYTFLAFKKTETGAIVEFFKIWRKKCKLPELSLLALAKHLLGVTARIELAITPEEPIDEPSRKWMNDPIVVLTGAARDFLVDDQGIFTAAEFLEARTKDLSLKLADWREKNEMVPLKGSGKVAMISGWKAAAREAVEAEINDGRVLSDVDFEAEAPLELLGVSEVNADDGKKRRSAGGETSNTKMTAQLKSPKLPKEPVYTRKLSISTTTRQVQYALNTKLFLEDVLGEDVTKILVEAGVSTAAEFYQMTPEKEAKLKECIAQARKATNDANSLKLIDKWDRKLENELETMVPKKQPEVDDKSVEQPKTKKAKTANDNKVIVGKKSEIKVTPKASASRHRTVDPYDSLSAVTKKFLGTMDIDTAEKFLKTRTTDIAQEFVEWRKKEGMAELKGLGAIASVSGWKATVRKAAKDMGQEDIMVMEPDNRSSWGPNSRNITPKPQKPKLSQSAPTPIPIAKPNPVFHEDALEGKPRVIFAVSAGSGDLKQYRFELSVRRPDDSSSVAVFATYRGSAGCSGEVSRNDYTLECVSVDDKTTSRLSIMKEVEYVTVGKSSTEVDVRSVFSSDLPGSGLVFLSPYGIRPLRNQDLGLLKSEVKAFVLDGKHKSPIPMAKVETKCNTIMRRNAFDYVEYFLYLKNPIEKGQCTEICFKELSYHLQSGSYHSSDYQSRHLLDEAFGLLSRSDLNQLLSFLEGDLLEATRYQDALSLLTTDRSSESAERFKAACGARRRLHWVATRIACALRDWVPSPPTRSEGVDKLGRKSLYFGSLLSQQEEMKTLPVGSMSDFRSALEVEVRNELLASLELDKVCGSEARKSWCPLFTDTFERVTNGIVDYYLKASDPSADDMLKSLGSCFSKCVATPLEEQMEHLVLVVRPSDVTGNNYLDDDLRDAMDKILHETGSKSCSNQEAVELIACNSSGDVEMADTDDEPQVTSVVFRTPNVLDDSSSASILHPNKAWYRQRQWWIMMSVVVKAGLLLSPEEEEKFMHTRTLYELKTLFLKDSGLTTAHDATLETLQRPRIPMINATYEPHSYPFFLGLVWPKLRALGWRLEAGDSPKDVTFIAPDIKAIPNKRANPWKQRRDIVRMRLARETNRTGIGNLTKTTKRLVVSTIPHPEGDEVESESREPKGVSLSEALQRFLQHVESKLSKDDANGRLLAARVVNIVKNCFDELAPMMMTDVDVVEGKGHTSDAEQAPPSERYGCDFLLRFLLVLPSILRQSNVPLQEINDCTEIIRELVDWMTLEYPKLLNKKYHPPEESYVPPKQPKQTPPELSQRLRMLHEATAAAAVTSDPAVKKEDGEGSVGTSNVLVMKELLRPEDKTHLTDFLVLVMEQAIPCRATESDVAKKYRRVNVGFPGFVCRHCMGTMGEGRYFFSTVESLTTASTVFEKHVGKCKSVPDEIKAAVVEAKTRHADQRKLMPVGAQQAYFNRLWDRLRSSQIEGVASGTYVLEGTAKKDAVDNSESSASEFLEFRDHIPLLDYVRSHAPWKSSTAVQEAINQYYGCIDYGGRVFYTSCMPVRFSSEWLLRKVGPRPKRSRKKRLMPG